MHTFLLVLKQRFALSLCSPHTPESFAANKRQSTKLLIKRFVILLGSLHLTLMATLGIWMWSNLVTFGTASNEANKCAVSSATLAVVFKKVPMGSKALQNFSLALYALFIIPGLNVVIPTALFLFLHFWCRWPFSPNADKATLGGKRSALPALVGLLFLLFINIIFIVDIEATLARNKSLQREGDEARWGFGQTLAVLLLSFPLRDLIETLLDRRIKRQQVKIAEHQLKEAMGPTSRDIGDISEAIKLGADFHKALDKEGTQSNLCLAQRHSFHGQQRSQGQYHGCW
jgi:hypothetical protein